jgi:predicted transcriptional regulator
MRRELSDYNTAVAFEPEPARAGRHRIRSWVRAARRRLTIGAAPPASGPSEALSAVFGPLELGVLEALWRRAEHASVRDLQLGFPAVAYTTLMTTLDRLFKKGVLERVKRGKAFYYAPCHDRDGLQTYLAADTFETLLANSPRSGTIQPLLSCFVDAVSRRDALLLDELEEMVRLRKSRRRRGKAVGRRSAQASR